MIVFPVIFYVIIFYVETVTFKLKYFFPVDSTVSSGKTIHGVNKQLSQVLMDFCLSLKTKSATVGTNCSND